MNKVKVCVTLLFKDDEELIEQIKVLKKKRFDIAEVRVDYIEYRLNVQKVCINLNYIKQELKKPVLMTIRSFNEGGYHIIDDEDYYRLYQYAIDHTSIDMIDIEVMKDKVKNYELIEYAHRYNKKVIMSYHNMEYTDKIKDLIDYAHQMELLGADMIKIVTLPRCHQDVITMMNLSCELSSTLALPVTCISLSEMGKITRVTGNMTGSYMTYVSLDKTNNLGQIYIDDIYKYLEV